MVSETSVDDLWAENLWARSVIEEEEEEEMVRRHECAFFWCEGISPTCTLLPSLHHPANVPYPRAGKAESLWGKNPAGRWWFIYASSVYHRWRRRSCSFRLLEAPGQQDRREEGRTVFTNDRLASLPPVVCFALHQHSLHPQFTFAEAGWPTFMPAWPCCGRRPHHGHLRLKNGFLTHASFLFQIQTQSFLQYIGCVYSFLVPFSACTLNTSLGRVIRCGWFILHCSILFVMFFS